MTDNPGSSASALMELDDLVFIEPSFADLTSPDYTQALIDLPADQGRLLVDEESDPLALAVEVRDGWVAGSFHLRRPTAALIERFEELGGDVFQDSRPAWAAAVREYYSTLIAREVTPALEDLNPSRAGQVSSLLSEFWGPAAGETCLDCCCGSGVGSQALRQMGFRTLSFDNDIALLSLGLHTGRLVPGETMHIDATRAEDYMDPADRGLGLMFGEINAYNQDIWEAITVSLVTLASRVLITVGTGREAERVRDWAQRLGRDVDLHENSRDPIYDRWVCLIEKE
ncbi:hypothetical protein J2741_001680 [Methanolinea mesophila]|uniref:hypothetical protein n=1 Tax=Methanolinea mesophila TaxID=547055 RepID=UPI001FD8173F|nr:hypothetical protein [Methanolinea mesophila]MBP1929133.1 hypothetical protein [Methanolinea mesophila]